MPFSRGCQPISGIPKRIDAKIDDQSLKTDVISTRLTYNRFKSILAMLAERVASLRAWSVTGAVNQAVFPQCVRVCEDRPACSGINKHTRFRSENALEFVRSLTLCFVVRYL